LRNFRRELKKQGGLPRPPVLPVVMPDHEWEVSLGDDTGEDFSDLFWSGRAAVFGKGGLVIGPKSEDDWRDPPGGAA
jgi:hypothetical protein